LKSLEVEEEEGEEERRDRCNSRHRSHHSCREEEEEEVLTEQLQLFTHLLMHLFPRRIRMFSVSLLPTQTTASSFFVNTFKPDP
jgi:hypothetical protein